MLKIRCSHLDSEVAALFFSKLTVALYLQEYTVQMTGLDLT